MRLANTMRGDGVDSVRFGPYLDRIATTPVESLPAAEYHKGHDNPCWPVSPRIGNVKNNDASLIEPIAAPISASI